MFDIYLSSKILGIFWKHDYEFLRDHDVWDRNGRNAKILDSNRSKKKKKSFVFSSPGETSNFVKIVLNFLISTDFSLSHCREK